MRRRVQLSFAAGGLLLSLVLGSVTWGVTSRYLYQQREAGAVREAAASRAQLLQGLESMPRPAEVLARAHPPATSAILLLDGASFSSELGLAPEALPVELLDRAAQGQAVQQRVRVGGEPVLAVALPLDARGNVYIELFTLAGLESGLRTLSVVLVAAGTFTTLLGAAVGRWASGRSLRPIQVLADGAAAVARGALDTRLDARGDADLRPLVEAFNDTTHRLQERVSRDARFASEVSHELRSPVTTMVNAVHVLDRQRDALTASGREALTLLRVELTAFATLVEDLLALARDVDAADLVLVETPLADVVRRAAAPLVRSGAVHVAPDAEGALVCADLHRLRRLITNLIVNAETHGGGVREVRVRADAEQVCLSVVDAGPGVPVDLRERIFERFYRGPAPRAQVRGAGLGLAMVEQDVQAHGGTVWVQDSVHGGACFVVRLPRVRCST